MQPQNDGQNPVSEDTFAPKTGSETNPFTADLKGEFTSNFGTNTNAVSQIFKEGGGFGGNSNARNIIILGLLLIGLGGAYFLLSDDGTDDFSDEAFLSEAPIDTGDLNDLPVGDTGVPAAGSDPLADESAGFDQQEGIGADQSPAFGGAATQGAPGLEAEADPGFATGGSGLAPSLISPSDGALRAYDEGSESAVFEWQADEEATIVFSRTANMVPEERRVRARGNSFTFDSPYPGRWYWRVETASGASEVRSFTVEAPVRRNIIVNAPQMGGALAGEGGVVSWTGDSRVAHYRVELTQGSWANPGFRFATAGTSIALSGVSPGQYSIRVGALSEVSRRWEYTQPMQITVE